MSDLSPQRRKVVILCAAIGSTGGASVLLKGHDFLRGALVGFMLVMLVYAITQFVKLKRSGL